ncbi:MAG TPA: radical SAM protein [Spirochaetota bacterium]|nr:radical SAM protein [Spirochaetota bacterium]HPJ34399.1 radical SAM protein [Spirochaetota bacterium]
MNKNIPRLIFWELTKRCNLNCAHCRAEAEDIDYSGEIDTPGIKKIMDDIASEYSPILILTGGEPLYRADIFDIASYAVSKKFRVALATNGTLINDDIAKKIKSAGIARASISIDGSTAPSHDGFRGIPGSFESALNGARLLKKNGVEFQFNMTVTKRNVDEIEDILALAVKEGAAALHLFMLVPVGCGVEIAETDMISAEKYEEVLNWFYDRSRDVDIEFKATCAPHYYRIIRQRAKEEGRTLSFETDGMAAMTRGCLAGTGVCFISHRGEVQPCGYLPLSAGNVVKTPFPEVWEKSELFATLRDFNMLKGKCGACEYKSVCGGCRARAFYAENDMLGEEPYCLYEPVKGRA